MEKIEINCKRILEIKESRDGGSFILRTDDFSYYVNYQSADIDDSEHLSDLIENNTMITFYDDDLVRIEENWGRWDTVHFSNDEGDDEDDYITPQTKGEILLLSEREEFLKKFMAWVSKNWIYNIKGSLFRKSLEKKGNFYKLVKGRMRKSVTFGPIEVDKLLKTQDWKELFKIFVAISLNKSSRDAEKWFVKNNSIISNIFINNNAEITILLDFEDFDKNFDTQKIIKEHRELINNRDADEFNKAGFSKKYYRLIKEMSENGTNLEEVVIRIAYITPRDYSEEIDEVEVWGLPAFFSKFSFSERANQKEDKVFTINSEQFGDRGFIKYSPRKNEEIIITPIRAQELVEFIENVEDKDGTIDSLFTLNVRDRKKISKTNKIFNGITNSIRESSDYFFMMNNGITAIVDLITLKNNKLSLKNIKIINGQQTTNSLYRKYKQAKENLADRTNKEFIEGMKDSFVMFKGFKPNSEKSDREKLRIYNKIASASNQQAKVNDSEILSTQEFNTILSGKIMQLGIFYQFRSGESDYSLQFKGMPKITLDELLKYDFMLFSNTLDAKNKKNKITNALITYHSTNIVSPDIYGSYAENFMEITETEKANRLFSSVAVAAFFKNKRTELKSDYEEINELAALDILIMIGLWIEKEAKQLDIIKSYQNVDVKAFRDFAYDERRKTGQGQNTYYKSKIHSKRLFDKTKREILNGNLQKQK